MDTKRKSKVFIDGLPLADQKMSGIGHLVLDTIKSLARNPEFHTKYELYIVLPLFKKRKVIEVLGLDAKFKVVPLPARALSFFEKNGALLPIDLITGKGVYIFPNYRNWPLYKSRSITYIHDISFKLFPETLTEKNLAYLNSSHNRWIGRSDVIVTLTESSKKDIRKQLKVNSEKVFVIPCGIDTRTYYPRPINEVETVKTKYGIHAAQYFIYVGNLEPRKNIDAVLSAISGINDANTPPLLIVGGQGWKNEDTLKQINNLKKNKKVITPNSYVVDEDIPAMISGATALIFPSLYEGFGMPPMEATGCGVLPIVSDIPVFRELFGADLEPWYFNPNDPEEIKKKITEVTIFEKTHKEQQIRLLQHNTKGYNWDISAKKLIQILDTLN